MIETILFDLDGVLVDACEWHYIALNLALKEVDNFEISKTDHETIFNGLPTKKKLNLLVEQNKISSDKIKKIWELKQKYTTDSILQYSIPDVKKIELHTYLQSKIINIGCVTNSIKETATLMLEKTGQLPFIKLLITNDMVKLPKPNGECYFTAINHFNSTPDKTLIVEDSEHGLTAAYSTKSNVWKVKNSTEVILENILRYL